MAVVVSRMKAHEWRWQYGVNAWGSSQAESQGILGDYNFITSASGPTPSVHLMTDDRSPCAWWVFNRCGQTITVYPPGGYQFEALGTTGSTTITSGGANFFCVGSGPDNTAAYQIPTIYIK